MKNILINITVLIISNFLLTGCLPIIFIDVSSTAMELAKNKSTAYTLTDVSIAVSIKKTFLQTNFCDVYSKIRIDVMQGRVLLTGILDNNEDIIKANRIAWNHAGVSEVINELTVNCKGNYQCNIIQHIRDVLITSQIKAKVLLNRSINLAHYTVFTINDVVYLFGTTRSQGELESVARISSNIHCVQQVISHVRIQSSRNPTKYWSEYKKHDLTKPDTINNLNYLTKDKDTLMLDNTANDW